MRRWVAVCVVLAVALLLGVGALGRMQEVLADCGDVGEPYGSPACPMTVIHPTPLPYATAVPTACAAIDNTRCAPAMTVAGYGPGASGAQYLTVGILLVGFGSLFLLQLFTLLKRGG